MNTPQTIIESVSTPTTHIKIMGLNGDDRDRQLIIEHNGYEFRINTSDFEDKR